jgi:acetyl esterase
MKMYRYLCSKLGAMHNQVMNIKKLWYVILMLSLAVSVPAAAQDFTTHLYKESGGRKLFLDVFPPSVKKSKKTAVIILFHGGALSAGQREIMHEQCRFFSHMGLVAISPSYYLLPKKVTDFPSQVAISIVDAKSALRWVVAHDAELGIDADRIVIGGASAGGFLATAAILSEDINDPDANLKVPKVKAVVLYNPAYSPKTRYTPDVVPLITKNTPPTIILFGDKDSYKPAGDEFYNQLAKYHVQSEMWTAAGQSHSFYKKPNWGRASNAKIFNFLCKVGVIKGKQLPEDDDALFTFQKPVLP